ncbi:MAG TPA: hypothetical protein VJ032_06700 [Thermoanaerobaculia bacterium]|nr:hypothetical protein [Thermoanaerobaculia bacterium]
MRIQETDRILKESRIARNSGTNHSESEGGMAGRAWKSIANLPQRLMGMFRHH